MPTQTWLYFGKRSLLDPTSKNNITQTQANAAVGWNAEDSSQFALTDTTGSPVSSSGGYRTTYQTSPGTAAEFSYRNPLTEASVSGQKVQSFVQATFQIKVPDYAGGQVLTRSGVVIQMQNGDVFLRPRTDALESWDNIPAIQKITVASATPFASDTNIATTGFGAAFANVPVACFARGTMIQTATGPVSVENLGIGDRVLTAEGDLKPIIWIGSTVKCADALAAAPHLRPIRIAAGALGAGKPHADLVVSPQHRVLVRSRIAQRMFGTDEVLVAAKQLLEVDGIDLAGDMAEMEYFHFLLDCHSIVVSNGAETETMFTGPEALKSVGRQARREILDLFPELADADYRPVPARELAPGRKARQLASRHARNGSALIEQ
ncbi:MAG: Hint domain-containing protein [Paracoccus sp. (in: a-proteobacteria)]|uniref:Hint domain-containing protein n=3 Tax=Paracoccus TaxID=265 RepID=UPI0030012544